MAWSTTEPGEVEAVGDFTVSGFVAGARLTAIAHVWIRGADPVQINHRRPGRDDHRGRRGVVRAVWRGAAWRAGGVCGVGVGGVVCVAWCGRRGAAWVGVARAAWCGVA
ncbi:hypothetical protein Acsp01_43270 [Actinoplanes sp. NBRC 101535]|nr:hypothetical protein Acsp01_43270 [Actinoplanes sp. NBRC 101535]